MFLARKHWRKLLALSLSASVMWLLRIILRHRNKRITSAAVLPPPRNLATAPSCPSHKFASSCSSSSSAPCSSSSSSPVPTSSSFSNSSCISSDTSSASLAPTLFSDLPGLALFENVLAPPKQLAILEFVNTQLELGRQNRLPKHTYLPVAAHHAAVAKSREMLQYGAYTHANRVEAEVKLQALPSELEVLVDAMVERGVFTPEQRPDSCTINCYEQGCWLPPHIDSLAFSRPFATLSLSSATKVLFGEHLSHEVQPDGGVTFAHSQLSVEMPVGSVLRLEGAAADVWLHALPPHPAPRVSLTFRRRSDEFRSQMEEAEVKHQEHQLSKHQHKAALKMQKKAKKKEAKKANQEAAKEKEKPKSQPVTVSESTEVSDPCATPSLEREHVQAVYDTIATQWHGTRYQAWPRVDAFIRSLPQGSLIADVGCGNGKNLPACNAVGFGMGSDISGALALIAKGEGHELAVADVMNLPYRSGCCDAVLCIAVLHHLSTAARRVRAMEECVRLLRVGGKALFYAWAQEQDDGKSGHRFDSQDVLVPFHLRVRDKDTPGFVESGAIDSRHVSSYLASTTSPSTSSSSTSLSSSSSPATTVPTTTTETEPTTTTETEPRTTSSSSSVTTTTDTSTSLELMQASHGVLDSAKSAVVFQRYCHVYKQGELEELFAQVAGVRLCEVYFDTGNWAVIVEKIA